MEREINCTQILDTTGMPASEHTNKLPPPAVVTRRKQETEQALDSLLVFTPSGGICLSLMVNYGSDVRYIVCIAWLPLLLEVGMHLGP